MGSGLGLQRVLGLFDQGIKGHLIADGDVGQHLAVEADIGGLETLDEAAVADAGTAAGGVQADDPQSADLALLLLLTRFLLAHGCRAEHLSGRADPRPVVHLQRLVRLVVGPEELEHGFRAKDAAEGLVLATEAQTHEAVPLLEVDRYGVERPRFDADDAGVHLGRGPEVVFAHF